MPTIAYLGPEKTNTHFAARRKFGLKAKYVHAPTVEDVFQMVEREQADFGVIPIENSLEGAVTHTLDRFVSFKQSPARIRGEIELPIQHYLITHPGKSFREVGTVFSHPQALAQCRYWLQKNLPDANLMETTSTSEAVGLLLRQGLVERALPGGRTTVLGPDRSYRAAIGRIDLAKELKLNAIRIPQDRENKTRFLVISLQKPKSGRRNKTSLLFALKDKPGALYDALMPFKRYRINLTKIESRPSKRKAWEYVFFVDLEGHESEPRVKKALRELERRAAQYRVLGSYPWKGPRGRG